MIFERWSRYADVGLLVARLGFGLGFVWFHGGPKLAAGPETWAGVGSAIGNFGIPGGYQWFGLAASLAEGVGGLCIALGLFFRPVAVILAFVMMTATVNHVVTGQGTPAHAFKNAFLFAGWALIGPGRYSLDYLLATRRRGREAAHATREGVPVG